MILREVGEDADAEVGAGGALLHEGVAGDFDGAGAAAVAHHVGEHALQLGGAGRGVVRVAAGGSVVVLDGADEAGALPGAAEDGVAEVADGGLAVGAGDAEHDELAAREAVPGAHEQAVGQMAVAHLHPEEVFVLKLGGAGGLGDDGLSTGGDGGGDGAVAVEGAAFHGDEAGAGDDGSAVIGEEREGLAKLAGDGGIGEDAEELLVVHVGGNRLGLG